MVGRLAKLEAQVRLLLAGIIRTGRCAWARVAALPAKRSSFDGLKAMLDAFPARVILGLAWAVDRARGGLKNLRTGRWQHPEYIIVYVFFAMVAMSWLQAIDLLRTSPANDTARKVALGQTIPVLAFNLISLTIGIYALAAVARKLRHLLLVVFVAWIIMIAATISSYAALYRLAGLMQGGKPDPTPIDFAEAYYFSIVTWTTLGYGDFTPAVEQRLVAVAQALHGSVAMSIMVGFAVAVMTAPPKDHEG